MRDFINPEVQGLKPSGIRKFFELASSTPGVVSLGVGEPDFDTPWHISDEGIASIEEGKTFYTSNSGLPELREAIGKFLKRKYNLTYKNDEILVTVGGSEAIDLACRSLLSKGEEAVICYPAYVSYEPCVLLAGGKVLPLQLKAENGFKAQAGELEKLLTPKTKLLMLNYPNNPTGAEMDLASLEALAEVCIRRDLFVVTDEIYSELVYTGKHISIASLPGMKERTLLINGFSKSYSMTGWRLGYAAGSKEVIAALTKIHQYSIMCPSTASQYAGIEALNNGDDDISRMRDEYAKRRLYILHRLTEMGLSCYEPQGAFYVFPSIAKFGLSSEEFCTRLVKEAKVAVIPGTAFGACGEGFVRISYAYSIKDIGSALDRMEKFLKKLEKE
jgi:aminotransferase